MLYLLISELTGRLGFLRVLHYPSFRIPAAALTALVLTLWLFPRFIEAMRRLQEGASNVREDTPQAHQGKKGTPTMGGLFILIAVVTSSWLWADLSNLFVWAVTGVMIGFGAIGFVDDYRKVRKKNSKGLAGKRKLAWQMVVLLVVAGLLIAADLGELGPAVHLHLDTTLTVPFVAVRWFNPDLGWLYLPFAIFVIMGTSHAVNLTDGLDGLAIGPTIVSSVTFLFLCYAGGLVLTFKDGSQWVNFNLAEYLNIPHIPGLTEVAVVCAAIAGAGVGFLWYNSFPASVFMGDVGSLSLGGALGTIAVLSKSEVLSAIIHGVFLAETLSVITQVASFKLTGKRVFKMAPIHHHYELKGWPEPKIIVRFWIVSVILALVGVMTLKLR